MDEAERRCEVCGQTAPSPREIARCADCDAPFHLNLRTDLPLPSCGAAVVGQACGYSLLCNPCIERDEATAGAGGAVRLRVL